MLSRPDEPVSAQDGNTSVTSLLQLASCKRCDRIENVYADNERLIVDNFCDECGIVPRARSYLENPLSNVHIEQFQHPCDK
ncbi:MAG TPA: hypothetical protein VL354_22110 [Spirochaetia bacterium]|nr:hypothetical protein [Spirochaetia bacterium]